MPNLLEDLKACPFCGSHAVRTIEPELNAEMSKVRLNSNIVCSKCGACPTRQDFPWAESIDCSDFDSLFRAFIVLTGIWNERKENENG